MDSNSQPKPLAEVVYTPESRLRHPGQLFQEMRQDLLASRELAWRLMVRDLSAQYRQSFLGIFWAFAPAVVTAVGLTVANNAKVLNLGQTDLPYPAYVMLSMTLWQTFVEAINGPVVGITQAKPMLTKINFPREAIVLAQIGQVAFNFCVKLVLIVGLFLWFKIPVTWSTFLAPVALIHMVILGTFFGMMLAPLAALYQDFVKGLTLVTSFWLFLTPVIYPPPSGSGLFSLCVQLNPVTPLLVTTRELATTGLISNPTGFWIASAIAWVGVLLAWLFYRISLPIVVERLSS